MVVCSGAKIWRENQTVGRVVYGSNLAGDDWGSGGPMASAGGAACGSGGGGFRDWCRCSHEARGARMFQNASGA